MLNLMKMDLYRMFHSLSTWIIILFTVGIALFCVVMVQGDLDAMAEDPAYAQEMGQEFADSSDGNEDRNIGLYSESDPEWVEGEIEAGEFISSQIQSGLLTLLVVIFAAVFASAEQKNGYIKNIAGQLSNRGILALSKLAASAVQIFLMFLTFILVTGAAGKLLWGGRFTLGSMTDMLSFLGAQYLLNMGIAALILFFCTLTKSSAFSMTAGIMMVMGLFIPIYSIINRAVYEIKPSWDFDISLLVPDGNIGLAGIHASSEILVRATAVGAVYVILCSAAAVLIMKKRDVR